MQTLTRTFTRHIAAALLIACTLPAAYARSFWLLPSDTTLSAATDKWITVDVGVSTAPFEHSIMGMALDNLRITAPDGTAVAPKNPMVGALRTVFDVPISQRGTWRIAVVDNSFFARWKDPKTGSRAGWRGNLEEFAQKVPANAPELQAGQLLWRIETFVTAGAPGKIPAAPDYAGQGIELQALTHPNDLAVGEVAQFAFHLNGKPAADLEVTITPGGFRWRNSADVIRLKTDAGGKVQVRWPAAGMYLINANAKDELGSAPQARQRQLFYAGTVEVLP